jgi:hypothetical protein
MARRYGYWICTALMALWLTPSGVLDLMRAPAVMAILQHLGYPDYLALILGAGKLLAMAAIFYPRTVLLREWAYAGLTFELTGAFLSHSALHDPIVVRAAPLTVLALMAASYLLRPERYRLQAVQQSLPAGSLSAE